MGCGRGGGVRGEGCEGEEEEREEGKKDCHWFFIFIIIVIIAPVTVFYYFFFLYYMLMRIDTLISFIMYNEKLHIANGKNAKAKDDSHHSRGVGL